MAITLTTSIIQSDEPAHSYAYAVILDGFRVDVAVLNNGMWSLDQGELFYTLPEALDYITDCVLA